MTTPHRPRHPFPHPAPAQEPTSAALDAAWEQVGLPEPAQWRAAFHRLFPGRDEATHPHRARRLHDYGFTPHTLTWVCTTPHVLAAFRDPGTYPEDRAEAMAALIHEATLFHAASHTTARATEVRYAEHLMDRGWNQPQIAALLGVTKQRVSALLKQPRHPRPRPRTPQHPVTHVDIQAGLARAASLGYTGPIAQIITEAALEDYAGGNPREGRHVWEANHPQHDVEGAPTHWDAILAAAITPTTDEKES